MPFLVTILKLVWPAAPAWVLQLIGFGLPAAIEVAEALGSKDATGPKKAEMAIDSIEEYLDELDDLPEWEDLTEAQRDRILVGLQELGYFLSRVGEKGHTRRRLLPKLKLRRDAPSAKKARAQRRARRKKRREDRRARRETDDD